MKLSYEGIGQWAATFSCTGVSEGSVVKVGANGTVSACAAGEAFCGTVSSGDGSLFRNRTDSGVWRAVR